MAENTETGTIIAIELTNCCNIRCPQCPQGKVEIPTGYMTREVLLESLQYCQGYTELNWRGESLLHPEVVEMVRLAKQSNDQLDIGFHSNVLLLTEELFEQLVEAGLDWLHVSLHTAESCRRYLQILEWNERRGMAIRLDGEVDTTEEDLMARSLGLTGDMFRRIHLANWAGFLTDHRVVYPDAEKRARACLFVRQNKFLVGWDGSAYPCCWDFEGRHRLGHVSDFQHIRHKPPYELCPYCIWVVAGQEQA